MRLRGWIVLIALLPALLVPGGVRVCLCLCSCISEAAAKPSCCAEPVQEEPRGEQTTSRAQLVAQCPDCAPFRTTTAEMQQISKASVDVDASHCIALTPYASIADIAPAVDLARSLYAARASAPPVPWARSFPLLI